MYWRPSDQPDAEETLIDFFPLETKIIEIRFVLFPLKRIGRQLLKEGCSDYACNSFLTNKKGSQNAGGGVLTFWAFCKRMTTVLEFNPLDDNGRHVFMLTAPFSPMMR